MISRQPMFDETFPNYGNTINEDLQNEEITSFELGYGYNTRDLVLNVSNTLQIGVTVSSHVR